jgi:hypothetical protein
MGPMLGFLLSHRRARLFHGDRRRQLRHKRPPKGILGTGGARPGLTSVGLSSPACQVGDTVVPGAPQPGSRTIRMRQPAASKRRIMGSLPYTTWQPGNSRGL